jgi:hypothetical protein
VLDANGNPIAGAAIASDSGFNYLVPVPEPTTFVALTLAIGALIVRPYVGRTRSHLRNKYSAGLVG